MSVAWLVLPDFLLIILGWVLHHRLGFSKEFFTGLEKLVYYVLFPALLFQSILKTPITPATAGDTLLATAALVAVGFALARLAGPLFKPSAMALASSTQCGFRFNTYLGLALALSLGGASGQTTMALILGFAIPMGNVAAVYSLAKHQGSNPLGALLRNPLFLSTVLGLVANLAGLQLPGPIDTTVGRLGSAAIALGILCIGPSLSWQGGQGAGKLVAWMVAVKLLLLPTAAWVIAWLIGFDALGTQMLVLFAALPCATAAYVLTVRMGGDGRLVSLIISVGTLASALTIPIWMILVR
jgi:malonate transporter and related proteins